MPPVRTLNVNIGKNYLFCKKKIPRGAAGINFIKLSHTALLHSATFLLFFDVVFHEVFRTHEAGILKTFLFNRSKGQKSFTMIEEKLVLWKESLQKNMNQTKYAIGQLIVIVWMAFRSVGHYLKRLIFGFAEAVCVFRDFCRYLLMYFLGEDVKGTLYGAVMFLMALSAGFCLWLGFALSAHSELQTLSFVGAGVMLLGIPVFWVEYLKYVKQRQEA